MATGGPLKSFFCHICQVKFASKDAQCIRCQGEFVEELNEPPTQPPPPPVSTVPSAPSDASPRGRTRDREEGQERRPRQGDQLGEMLGQYLLQLIAAREQLEDSENYTLPVIPPPPQFLELMFRGGHRSNRPQQPSRDYSAPGALDSVITRLLEQLGGSGGPPPAEQDKIDGLPTFTIRQEHVDKELECSICKELFKLEEDCRTMPCLHFFHNDCIIAWLKIRGTCPTCRYDLNKGKVVSEEQPT